MHCIATFPDAWPKVVVAIPRTKETENESNSLARQVDKILVVIISIFIL